MDNKTVMTADFINRLADKGYTKKDSAIILADVLDIFYNAIENGEEVKLTGFGSICAKPTKAKEYLDVRTGERKVSRAHNKISFKPGMTLKRAAEMAE